MNKHALRFLLPAAALAATLGSAFAQNNLSVADIQRQDAIVKAHKSDLGTINATLGLVDAAVLCHVKDAKWGMTYRPIVLRSFDQFMHEIGVSNEDMIYALHLDMESNAHKLAIALPCEKMTGEMVDDLAAMLAKAP